jgi:hypothetical protein
MRGAEGEPERSQGRAKRPKKKARDERELKGRKVRDRIIEALATRGGRSTKGGPGDLGHATLPNKVCEDTAKTGEEVRGKRDKAAKVSEAGEEPNIDNPNTTKGRHAKGGEACTSGGKVLKP